METQIAKNFHKKLGSYFEIKALGANKNWTNSYRRGFSETVFQYILAKDIDNAVKLSTDYPFVFNKIRHELIDNQMDDYEAIGSEISKVNLYEVKIWYSFFKEKIHILRRGDKEWPVYKIFLQLSIEHADDSPLTIASEQWLAENACDWFLFRRIQRMSHAQRNSCLAVFEGHTGSVAGALELADGKILSWSYDNTLRIWDKQSGRCLTVLEGHRGFVYGAHQLADCRILSWSEDKMLRLWSPDGRPLITLGGHTGPVGGALELENDRIVSWVSNGFAILWSKDGILINTLVGHKIGHIQPMLDGRLLSFSHMDGAFSLWSRDGEPVATRRACGVIAFMDDMILSWDNRTLHIWSKDGKEIATLRGHTDWIHGALTLTNGRILSWSRDQSLRLWSPEGKELTILKGHTKQVNGAMEMKDGRIISWGSDETIRLWSSNGILLEILEGHMHLGSKIIELSNGNFLSWFPGNGPESRLLRLWLTDGTLSAVLDEHTDSVDVVVSLFGGIAISSTLDGALWLWSAEGHLLTRCVGHSSTVLGVKLLTDTSLLSWSSDSTLRLWSTKGASSTMPKERKITAKGALVLSDGNFLSWSDETKLRIWSKVGVLLAELEGHTGPVAGAIGLSEARCVTWSSFYLDNSLCLWSASGGLLAKLDGHTSSIVGVLTFVDGRILSWSEDMTLRMWSDEGSLLATFNGHTGAVVGALALGDGRVLSWSKDKTLRLWSEEGNLNATLNGHIDTIGGALIFQDGSILSWADHSSNYYWSPEFRHWTTDGRLLGIGLQHGGSVECAYVIPGEAYNRFISWSHAEFITLWTAKDLVREEGSWLVKQGRLKENPLGSIKLPENLIAARFFALNKPLARKGACVIMGRNMFSVVGACWHSDSRVSPLALSEDSIFVNTVDGAAVIQLFKGLTPITFESAVRDHRLGCSVWLRNMYPRAGPSSGGTQVELIGMGFQEGAVVRFGESNAKTVLITSTNISAITPASAAGDVSVTVINPDGGEAEVFACFRYELANTAKDKDDHSIGTASGINSKGRGKYNPLDNLPWWKKLF